MGNLALLDPRFGYLLAESFLLQEKKETADRIVELTLARVQVDARGEVLGEDNKEQDNSAFNRRLQEMLQRNSSFVFERANTSSFLIKRGLFDWAEKELRIAIQGHEDDVEYATTINLNLLSQLLHDTSRNSEAAEVLKKYVDRYEREPMFQNQVATQSGDALVSNYYLYSGDDAREKGDPAQARRMYLKSIEISHENVDAIIGLYRLDDASEQAVAERKKIQREVMNELKKEIEQYERNLRRENLRMQATDQLTLANQMNTFAWLVCNTEGNFEEALFLSRKACAMAPNRSAYLDTLAHCYASLGRYREAVEQQRKAVALEPHQASLSNALKRFEAKLQEQPGA
jgi:tetratricopeptide (TPR) repeat protein